MAKLCFLLSKLLTTNICLVILAILIEYANSARILEELTPEDGIPGGSDPIFDKPDIAPTAAPITSLPSGQIPAVVATPVANVANNSATPTSNVAPVTATSASGAGAVADVGPDHPTLSFFMHDILGNLHPPGVVVTTGVIANTETNSLPFSNPNSQILPLDRVPLNTINNYPLPAGLTPRQLKLGSITVVDAELAEGQELGTGVIGRAQGFYLTSSQAGSKHTLALTTLFFNINDEEVEDTINFFGLYRTATPDSRLAIIGGTGRYKNAKGYATIENCLDHKHTITDGVEIITHFSVYLEP